MNRIEDTAIEAVLEHLITDGAGGMGAAFARMFELAMRAETGKPVEIRPA
jgi:hypothetical protein